MPQPTVAKVPIPAKPATVKSNANETANMVTDLNLEANGMRPRKPCNCTKSQCLKLYCDCFANGEFCYLCNCMNCYNNLDNEEHRQRAIKSCLERNPNAFRPKIGKTKEAGDTAVRKHTKGCNCKRSGCLKNYCECYEVQFMFIFFVYLKNIFRRKLHAPVIVNAWDAEMLKMPYIEKEYQKRFS